MNWREKEPTQKQIEYIYEIEEDQSDESEIFIGWIRRHSKQLIRCKDCKHRDPADKKCDCGHDIMWQLPRPDDWFCADGERKEE